MLLLQFSLVVRVFPSPMVLTVRLSEVRYRGCMGHPRARLGVNLYALSCLCCRTIVPLPSSYSHKSCWSVPSSSSSSSSCCGAIPPLYGVHRSCCRCSGIRLYGPNAVVADILGRVPSRRSQLLWLSAAALAPGSSIGSAMVSAGDPGVYALDCWSSAVASSSGISSNLGRCRGLSTDSSCSSSSSAGGLGQAVTSLNPRLLDPLTMLILSSSKSSFKSSSASASSGVAFLSCSFAHFHNSPRMESHALAPSVITTAPGPTQVALLPSLSSRSSSAFLLRCSGTR